MEAQYLGTIDEELTARMSFKLAAAASQKPVRRARLDERRDFIEFQKLHDRQETAGGERNSGR
jgi:hypothetical protein